MTCGKLIVLLGFFGCFAAVAAGQTGGFDKGAWGLELTGAYIMPIRFSEAKFYNVNLLASWPIVDHLTFGPEIQGYYVDQPGENAVAAGAGVVGRWHFLTYKEFSVFVDGGGGVVYADPEVPEFGTHFNFTGKGGFGMTWRIRDEVQLIGGVRYFHLSNGNIHGRDQNPSFDGVQFYGGVEWRF
jgi:hypothetical protein